MAEEKEGFFSQIKNQIIATIGVVITATGGIAVTNMESIFSPAEPEVVKEVVVDSTSNKQPNIIINVPTAQPVVKERIIVKEVPVEEKKEKEEKIDW
jgi:hypothetical protein